MTVLIAVISDIHANLQALEAVLAAIDDRQPDEIWCLGDIVGYGADPDACAALVRERTDVCLAGNHDLVVRGDINLSQFATSAGAAARWTIERITPRTLDFLRTLEPVGERAELSLYHASPRDPIWEYVLSIEQAADALDAQHHRLCLIGHSHVACYFTRDEGEVDGALASAGAELDVGTNEWLLNPGSVGQPRDGDPRAALMWLDTDAWRASFERVEYSVELAAAAIIDAGLPRQLGERLYEGR